MTSSSCSVVAVIPALASTAAGMTASSSAAAGMTAPSSTAAGMTALSSTAAAVASGIFLAFLSLGLETDLVFVVAAFLSGSDGAAPAFLASGPRAAGFLTAALAAALAAATLLAAAVGAGAFEKPATRTPE